MNKFEIKSKELTGFDLGGYMAPSGVIKLTGSGRYIAEWPKEITLMDNIYELEDIVKGSTNPETGEQWQNAEYC